MQYLMGATSAAVDGNIAIDPFRNLMDNSTTPIEDQWFVQIGGAGVVERPGSPVDDEVMRAYEKMDLLCEQMEPWHLHDPKAPLHYVLNRVKGFTTDLAMRSAAPFLHRYLYRDNMPQSILSCFAANVLYANRTPANTAMVMRAVYNNAKELVDVEASRVTATPLERLARAQALFLYQVIRLLDGDVALRAQGERDMPLLRMWLADLCRVRENLGDMARLGDREMRKQPPAEWKRWIFAESLRRTVLMAHSFISLYDLMKDPEGNGDESTWGYAHRWTLSRHLWAADSSSEFVRMWKEKPHFVITNYSLDYFLGNGRGEDADEFAEIILSIYMGVDEKDEFVSVTAGRASAAPAIR
ncbi:Transcription factor domain-containing protein [Madurella fahalii]|uniref:Transcription factor domain-containing protein n=1 Tax=Madurella fahalii TaxID=1157608 RepID=A0ABQ0GKE6_9PEZI